MSPKTNILMTGVTGFIGGSVLARFLEHPDFENFKITAIVRSADKAAKLKELKVNAVVGSHSDASFMESLASDSDVVIAMADADNFEAAQATLRGLKKRYEATGKAPIFIHTSGTGVLTDRAVGDSITETIYDDANPDQIESLPHTQVHRNVDLELVRADKEGYVKTYIILPSTIYGIATGILVDRRIQNPHSLQVPALIRASLARGHPGMIGEGKNIWPNVDIVDVSNLYVALYDSIQKNPSSTGHGREGYYFGETGEHNMYEVGQAIGEAMVSLGKTTNTTPTTFTKDEVKRFFAGSTFLGTNSRCRANRSRSIGWKPVKTKKDFLDSIKTEVEVLAKDSDHKEYKRDQL